MKTLADFENVIELVADGSTVLRACQTCDIDPRTFYRAIGGNPDLRAEFERAKEIGFETQADTLFNIHEKVRDPLAAKVLSDNIKWLLSKRRSTIYGDKLAVAVNHSDDLTQILRAAIDRIPLAPRRDQELDVTPENITISDIFGDETPDHLSGGAPMRQIGNEK